MARLEVRCCCDASKVLGHLEHPKLQKLGDRWRFPLFRETGRWGGPVDIVAPTAILDLQVDEVFTGYEGEDPVVTLAIKNRDYPIEQLRRIPGFEEAQQLDG